VESPTSSIVTKALSKFRKSSSDPRRERVLSRRIMLREYKRVCNIKLALMIQSENRIIGCHQVKLKRKRALKAQAASEKTMGEIS